MLHKVIVDYTIIKKNSNSKKRSQVEILLNNLINKIITGFTSWVFNSQVYKYTDQKSKYVASK